MSNVKASSIWALAIVSVLGVSACSSDSSSSSTTADPTATTVGLIQGAQSYDGLARNHVDGTVDYPQSPPVGGDHSPVWQNCGVYDQPVRNENAVHSMEHGAVWLAYDPELPADQVAVLAAFAVNQTHVLVAPYQGLTNAVTAIAWGVQLALSSVTDPRLAQFVEKYQEGPQTPELGVTCSGGTGDPIS